MTTTERETQSNLSSQPSGRSRRNMTKAQRYAEQCKPLPAVAGETTEERIDRLDRSLDYLSQCFQDEFEVRSEGSLLVDVITRVLLPFAALSTAASLLYVRLVQWTAVRFPSFERVAAFGYLIVLALMLLLLLYARSTGRLRWVNQLIDKTEDFTDTSVPVRKETLTRNNLVNRWIYLWVVGAFTLFIPLTFIALRSGVGDDLGVRLAIDTANVCDGPGRVRLFTGSSTCVEIQEDHDGSSGDTHLVSSTGDDGRTSISSVEAAESPIDAHIAEIRLDTTTTLALAVAILLSGILASMGLWWWRNRTVRDIAVLW